MWFQEPRQFLGDQAYGIFGVSVISPLRELDGELGSAMVAVPEFGSTQDPAAKCRADPYVEPPYSTNWVFWLLCLLMICGLTFWSM